MFRTIEAVILTSSMVLHSQPIFSGVLQSRSVVSFCGDMARTVPVILLGKNYCIQVEL